MIKKRLNMQLQFCISDLTFYFLFLLPAVSVWTRLLMVCQSCCVVNLLKTGEPDSMFGETKPHLSVGFPVSSGFSRRDKSECLQWKHTCVSDGAFRRLWEKMQQVVLVLVRAGRYA